MNKNVFDINALASTKSGTGLIIGGLKSFASISGFIIDTFTASLGCSVAIRLISATSADGNYFLISQTIELHE